MDEMKVQCRRGKQAYGQYGERACEHVSGECEEFADALGLYYMGGRERERERGSHRYMGSSEEA